MSQKHSHPDDGAEERLEAEEDALEESLLDAPLENEGALPLPEPEPTDGGAPAP